MKCLTLLSASGVCCLDHLRLELKVLSSVLTIISICLVGKITLMSKNLTQLNVMTSKMTNGN